MRVCNMHVLKFSHRDYVKNLVGQKYDPARVGTNNRACRGDRAVHAGVRDAERAVNACPCAGNRGAGMRAREQVRPGLGRCAESSAPQGLHPLAASTDNRELQRSNSANLNSAVALFGLHFINYVLHITDSSDSVLQQLNLRYVQTGLS